MRTLYNIFVFLCVAVLSGACSGNTASHTSQAEGGDTLELRYARLLRMREYPGYTVAEIKNPWDTTRLLATYLLVERDAKIDEKALPEGIRVEVPLKSSVVYTDIHASLIDELGEVGAIKGICDAQYVSNKSIQSLVKKGKIADCGSSMNPTVEKIAMIGCDGILLSAFENSGQHNKVASLGVPVIDCPDYMEVSPLARAEWIRFFGRLYGRAEKADSLFRAVEKEYLEVKDNMAKSDHTGPVKVLFDKPYQGSWSIPAAGSTMAILLADAGGTNPFSHHKGSGGVALSAEEVLYKAHDADLWLLRVFGGQSLTLSSLKAENDIFTRFEAFKKGNVYECDTQASSYFYDSAFRPHLVLREYADLIAGRTDNLTYFRKLSQ